MFKKRIYGLTLSRQTHPHQGQHGFHRRRYGTRSHHVCARERFDLDTHYVVRLRRMQVFSLYNHLKINKLNHKTVKILRGPPKRNPKKQSLLSIKKTGF
jgi:hypothetical protein